MSLERVLEGIDARLRSEEVWMVMDALGKTKRFHAALSFITDPVLWDAKDLGGSLYFFFGIDEANEYRQSTSATH